MDLRPVLYASIVVSALVACSQPVLAGAADEEAAEDFAESSEEKEKALDRFERDGSVFDSAPPENSGEGTLLFQPALEYSGFDGVHAFKVPISVHGNGSDLVLTADDPSAVTITPVKLVDATRDKGTFFMLETKKAGLVTLTATSRGQTAQAELHIASYAAARWTAGEQRYNNAAAGDPACKQCHGGGQGIDHSPAAIASITDGEVGRIMTAGEKPGFIAIGDTSCPSCSADGQQHIWKTSDEERQGLIAYLRGLDPRGFR